jgi:NAD(P)-dependent dehydrogenase (short-subunit alcohol dehydrogenase family)
MDSKPVALVTGASRGIGRSIAIELARCGFDIAGNATSYDPKNTKKGLAEVKAKVEALGSSFLPAPGDIADLNTHGSILSSALERFERIDLLVNNAGTAPKERLDILETTPKNFDHVYSVNTRGTFFLTQAVARHMEEQVRKNPDTKPAIIFISSVSSYVSSPSRAEYCISKAAISHAAQIFAHRLAATGINVYDVRPGIIKTDMTQPVEEKYNALIQEGLIPQGRWGLPEDVARAVAALARGDFKYSTGGVIEISGGMHIHRL